MGVAVVVLGILVAAETNTLITLLGIGLFCLGLSTLDRVDNKELDEIQKLGFCEKPSFLIRIGLTQFN